MKKLIALLISLPLFAGGKAWVNLGYGTFSQQYDSDGNAQDIDGSYSVFNVHLGGSYDFYSLPTLTFFGGGDIGLSQHTSSPDQGNSVSSGFSPQNIALFAGARGLFFKGKLGFLFDLGPESDTDKIQNSDRQNALFISLSGNLPNPMFSLGAGIKYILTMEGEENNIKYDLGDYFALFVKAGYKFLMGEVGIKLFYRMRTTAKIAGLDISDSDGNHLSLIPYVVINPPALPVSFFLKGAVMDEYLPYGFSIMGKNDPVTRLGFTLGGVFKF